MPRVTPESQSMWTNDELFSAVLNNNVLAIHSLVLLGADVNYQAIYNGKEISLLMLALVQKNHDAARFLLNAGADLTSETHKDNNMLYYALSLDEKTLLDFLERAFKSNAFRLYDYELALFFAAEHGYPNVVDLILEKATVGSDYRWDHDAWRKYYNQDILIVAAKNGQKNVVDIVLKIHPAGAKHPLRNSFAKAITAASKNSRANAPILELLRKYNALVIYGDSKLVHIVVENNASEFNDKLKTLTTVPTSKELQAALDAARYAQCTQEMMVELKKYIKKVDPQFDTSYSLLRNIASKVVAKLNNFFTWYFLLIFGISLFGAIPLFVVATEVTGPLTIAAMTAAGGVGFVVGFPFAIIAAMAVGLMAVTVVISIAQAIKEALREKANDRITEAESNVKATQTANVLAPQDLDRRKEDSMPTPNSPSNHNTITNYRSDEIVIEYDKFKFKYPQETAAAFNALAENAPELTQHLLNYFTLRVAELEKSSKVIQELGVNDDILTEIQRLADQWSGIMDAVMQSQDEFCKVVEKLVTSHKVIEPSESTALRRSNDMLPQHSINRASLTELHRLSQQAIQAVEADIRSIKAKSR